MTQAGLASALHRAMSLNALRRPLKSDERRRLYSERDVDPDAFQVLAEKIGERAAGQVAERLVCTMMLASMNARMLDAQRGPVPKFIKHLERSVRTFNRHIR